MTRIDAEQVSQLIDGELVAERFDEVVGHLERSKDLQRDWQEYQLIGDALRRSLPERVGFDVSARVAAAVADEPAYLLPGHGRGHKPGRGRRLAPVIGFAMAASLSAIAVLNILSPSTPGQDEAAVVASRSSQAPLAVASRDAVSMTPAATAEQARAGSRSEATRAQPGTAPAVLARLQREIKSRRLVASNVSYPTEAADLYDYLVNYSRYSQRGTGDDMLSHVSLASYRR